MGVKGIWRANATTLALLIVVNLALTMAGGLLGMIVGIAVLLTGMYLCFRQGMALGHGACGISSTVEGARRAGEEVYAQLDRSYVAQAWSRDVGLRGLLASALIPYAAGGIYILLSLSSAAPQAARIVARTAAWLLSLPFWPLISIWHEDFVSLTPDIAAMLLISPFVLPACTFAGYLQGPRLWANSEAAMKAGRRRAKARARVGKKMVSRKEKPEI